jgi:diguanylate cyclase (GGDEF)-like protein
MNSAIEAQLSLSADFPSPPGVATHIIALARDPEVDMPKVAMAISLDSALTMKILRIANSPLYAQRRRIETLRQALVVLGLNATLTLALSFSLVKSLRGGKFNGLDYSLYWRRSLLAGTAARALADAMHQPRAEEYFLAGLLQDVGMLALDRVMPEIYRGDGSASNGAHTAIQQHERKILATDHAAIGARAMRTWKLPEFLCRAIGNSHAIDLGGTPDPALMLDRCVALSGPIADLFLSESTPRPIAETALAVERGVGLDRIAFGQILATIGSIIPETEAIFDARLLGAQNAESLLDQARDVLMLRGRQVMRDVDQFKAAAASAGPRETREPGRTGGIGRDVLAGVQDRPHLEQFLALEFEGCLRQGAPLSLAFGDLDQFKRINDSFGQQAGDRILQKVARVLRENTRESDLIAGCGGEKFVVVLPATDAGTARRICERIVLALNQSPHDGGTSPARVTISVGCATHDAGAPFASVDAFVTAADRALQTARSLGRNRTVCFDPQSTQAMARA